MKLKTAAASCQKLMSVLLRGTHGFASNVLDDIVIISKDFQSHIQHVKEELERLRNAGLTLNAKKCTFATDTLRIFEYQLEKRQNNARS